jgi:hypothetical protein
MVLIDSEESVYKTHHKIPKNFSNRDDWKVCKVPGYLVEKEGEARTIHLIPKRNEAKGMRIRFTMKSLCIPLLRSTLVGHFGKCNMNGGDDARPTGV